MLKLIKVDYALMLDDSRDESNVYQAENSRAPSQARVSGQVENRAIFQVPKGDSVNERLFNA